MSTAFQHNFISVQEYLDGEIVSQQKHEYVDGVGYAQAGASNTHNQIATNATVELGSQLRGNPCRVFNSDTKIRIRQASSTRFYYPDLSVVCRLNAPDDTFQDQPQVIVEVVSESTRRIDEGEKRETYLTLPSLTTYVLLEQSSAAALVYQRGEERFEKHVYTGLGSRIPLPEIGCDLSLGAVYDGIDFPTQA
jgi:Uma2 family endonuclease